VVIQAVIVTICYLCSEYSIHILCLAFSEVSHFVFGHCYAFFSGVKIVNWWAHVAYSWIHELFNHLIFKIIIYIIIIWTVCPRHEREARYFVQYTGHGRAFVRPRSWKARYTDVHFIQNINLFSKYYCNHQMQHNITVIEKI